jgi:hypothetical protein
VTITLAATTTRLKSRFSALSGSRAGCVDRLIVRRANYV